MVSPHRLRLRTLPPIAIFRIAPLRGNARESDAGLQPSRQKTCRNIAFTMNAPFTMRTIG
jgi:hypothetical protein